MKQIKVKTKIVETNLKFKQKKNLDDIKVEFALAPALLNRPEIHNKIPKHVPDKSLNIVKLDHKIRFQ